jgi:hypothetical protein
MKIIREEINVELIFETYKVKTNSPNLTYSKFCIYKLGTSVTIVNGWKNSTINMSPHKKDKVFELTGLKPEDYVKIVTLYV